MPSRSGRSRSSGRAQRRRTTWVTVTGTHSVPAANGYDSIDLLAGYKAIAGAAIAGITIARTHLRVTPTAGLTAANNNFCHGLLITDQNDIGTNIVGAPRPAADTELDWMYWEWNFTPASAPGQYTDLGSGSAKDINLKSMRKMHQVGNTYAHVVQVPASAAFPAVFSVTGRVLLMLP